MNCSAVHYCGLRPGLLLEINGCLQRKTSEFLQTNLFHSHVDHKRHKNTSLQLHQWVKNKENIVNGNISTILAHSKASTLCLLKK